MRIWLTVLAVPTFAVVAAGAAASGWTLFNPTGRAYQDEVLRIKTDLPAGAQHDTLVVREDGQEVAWQLEQIDGTPRAWVATALAPTQTHVYSVAPGRPKRFAPRIRVAREGADWIMDSGALAVRVPAEGATAPRSPVLKVRLPDGKWVGDGTWTTSAKLKAFRAEVVGDGTIFGKIRLRYDFEGLAGANGDVPAYTEVTVALLPGRRHVVIEEAFAMPRGSRWEFDAAAGWAPRSASVVPHFGGFGRPTLTNAASGTPFPWPPNTLQVGQTRMGDTLLNLIPRWSQAYDDGWFFAAHDGQHAVGALPAYAGKWLWPHDSMIEIKVRDSADYAGLRCPVWRGRRCWLLCAGPLATWTAPNASADYLIANSFEALDKLHHDYVLDWPGQTNAPSMAGVVGRRSKPFFGWGPGAGGVASSHPLRALATTQIHFDPDTFGDYWSGFSPENPNFATVWWCPVYWDAAKLKAHPRFKEFAKLAEARLREDLYHSVTLPGGAGQECPGYMSHSMGCWRDLATHCRTYLGFDPAAWPQWKAAGAFHLHASQPMGDGTRRSHPGGDTHPPGPDVVALAKSYGVEEDIATFVTEELPGFGVIFRNRPATPNENYLAFKSGPNRGHYHGDQLSFHYCPYARPQVVDHHCSYGPRAGQEHMHNRVAFHTAEFPFANMDGFERVLAVRTSPDADVAVGQVDSERLRRVRPFPPEEWDSSLPEKVLDTPLQYRRTIVFLKNGPRDYFVIRDQHAGPDVFATYCLHVYGENCERRGNTFDFDALSVVVAAPAEFEVSRHDWQHSNGGLEATKGLRLTTRGRSGEFITVLMPKPVPPSETVALTLPAAIAYDAKDRNGNMHRAQSDLRLELACAGGVLSTANPRLSAPGVTRGPCRATVAIAEDGGGWKVTLQAELLSAKGSKDNQGTYTLRLRRDGDLYTGDFEGVYGGNPVKGQLTGKYVRAAFPLQIAYSPDPPPAVTPIPGGVRVGDDEVVFSGGVSDEDDTVYVRVRRTGKELLSVTGRDIDMDRSQGEVGLCVPDAGYPFGVVPDWLIRQRSRKPDWYRNIWPLTTHNAK